MQTIEIRSFGILYKGHVTNENVHCEIKQIGVYEDILIMVYKRTVKWYGHVSRSSLLAKTRKREIDGQKKRWEDNTKEWTGIHHDGCKETRKGGKKPSMVH